MNNKTVHRAFTVLLCLITVFVMIMAVTPLSFADSVTVPLKSGVNALSIDSAFPCITRYFYGANSGIIDCKAQNGYWYRVVINNTIHTVTVEDYEQSNTRYMRFYVTGSIDYPVYSFQIASSYPSSFNSSNSSSKRWTSWTEFYYMQLGNISAPYIRCCNCSVNTDFATVPSYSNFYLNAYYPFTETNDSKLQSVVDNQNSIASQQESNASSRQAEIMSEGSDLTVSTIDNWVGGQDGLAAKMTNLAATLSVNADRFSSNQAQVSAQLSSAGAIISNAFGKFPSVIVACMFCFLIILIAVKVVGR